MTTVLFACVQNAGRSQMAAAVFNRLVNPAQGRALSAGTHPADRVHAVVVDAMREIGIDLSTARPQLLTPEMARSVDWLITMGCGDECPVAPGVEREDWPLPDPKGKGVDDVRAIRDEIASRVRDFIERQRLR